MVRLAGIFLAFALISLPLAWSPEAYGRRYSLTEIPREDSQGMGAGRINDAGQVVGIIQHIGEPQRPWNGFGWSRTSDFTDLGEGPGALSINNAGTVVGVRYDPQQGHDAFLWTP